MKITEIFTNTLQGEGLLLGEPATFIRLAGCVEPLCDFCDSKYSWATGKTMSVDKIVGRVKKYKPELVVITGGEPYLQSQELRELVNELMSLGLRVQIETSGKLPIFKIRGLVVVMSPKWYDGRYQIARTSDLRKADQLKFVVSDWKDFSQMLHLITMHDLDKSKVCVMAEGVTRQEQIKKMRELVKYCVSYGIKLSPRLHVLIWDKKRRV